MLAGTRRAGGAGSLADVSWLRGPAKLTRHIRSRRASGVARPPVEAAADCCPKCPPEHDDEATRADVCRAETPSSCCPGDPEKREIKQPDNRPYPDQDEELSLVAVPVVQHLLPLPRSKPRDSTHHSGPLESSYATERAADDQRAQ